MSHNFETISNLGTDEISLKEAYPSAFVKESEKRPEILPKPDGKLKEVLEHVKDYFRKDNNKETDPETEGQTVATAKGLIKEVFILHALRERGITCIPKVLDSQSGVVEKGRKRNKTYSFASAALENIEGQDLHDYEVKSETDAISIFRKAAEGLNQIYQAGIIHNDVKPSNLMITNKGEIIVIDFNCAEVIDEEGKIHSTAGTAGFSAPEKSIWNPETQSYESICDVRSDIYSLTMTMSAKLGVRINDILEEAPEIRSEAFVDQLQELNRVGLISEKMSVFLMWNAARDKEYRCANYDEFIQMLDMVSDPRVTTKEIFDIFSRKMDMETA
jgi:serine/threonine protein kinase